MPRNAKLTPGRAEGSATLPAADLILVAEAVKLRAEREGYIVEVRDVRTELERAGSDSSCWPQILKLASTHLVQRDGRYYYVVPTSQQRDRQELHHQVIQDTINKLVDQYRLMAEQNERREASRIHFVQPVTVLMEGGGVHRALTKDISASGIRLLGTRGMLGQKVQVDVPTTDGNTVAFMVRMVWTCEVGDDLYENGGVFLEVVKRG